MLIVPTIFSVWKPDSDAQLDNVIRKQGTKTTRGMKKCLCLTLVLPVVGHIVWAKFPFLHRHPYCSDKALLGPVLQQRGARTNNRFPCSLASWAGVSLYIIWGEGKECVQRLGQRAGLRCFAHPWGNIVCRGHVQYPAFAFNPLLLL